MFARRISYEWFIREYTISISCNVERRSNPFHSGYYIGRESSTLRFFVGFPPPRPAAARGGEFTPWLDPSRGRRSISSIGRKNPYTGSEISHYPHLGEKNHTCQTNIFFKIASIVFLIFFLMFNFFN